MKKAKTNNRVRVSYKQLIKFIQSLGYEESRRNRSDHVIYKNKSNKTTVIPDDRGTVPIGTLMSILKQVDCTRQDLAEFLNE